MTATRLRSFLLIFFLVLASCDSDDIVPVQHDWCYVFDFTTNSHQINFINGSWVSGDGLWPNASGALSANYAQTALVKPEYMTVTIAPVSGTSGLIDVQANAIIFGVPFALNSPVPADIGEYTLPVPITDLTASGTTFNFSLQVNQPVLVRQLEVRGNGLNPFPFNNCEQESTPTPSQIVPDTLTPTASPTPTATDTPTPNLTITPMQCVLPGGATPTSEPSPTPDCNQPWEHEYDFVANNGGWSSSAGGYYGTTNYVSGSGWGSGQTNYTANGQSVYIWRDFDYATTITQTEITFNITGSWSGGACGWGLQGPGPSYTVLYSRSLTASGGQGTQVSPGISVSGVRRMYMYCEGYPNGGSRQVIVSDILLRGTGINPMDGTGQCYIPPAETPMPLCTITPTATASDVPASSTPHPTGTNIPRTPTASPTPTRTPVVIASPTRTNTPGPTNTNPPPPNTATAGPTTTPIPSATYIPTQGPPVDPEDPDPGPGEEWGDCDAYIEVSSLWDLGNYVAQYWNCAVVPYFENILNSITDFFSWAVNTGTNIFGWLGGVPGWIGGWLGNIGIQISNIWQLLLGLLGLVLSFIITIFQIVGLVIAIIINLLFLLGGWISQFTARAEGIITAWMTAAPQPIPSLPQCVSSPSTSDVCAFYYVAQHTFLSGTIGQLLVPVAVIIMDLIIVMFFIRKVRDLIKKSSEVTQ